MNIHIYQGNEITPEDGDANIVIDVIRAFTVAHHAFLGGVKEIWLADSKEAAFCIKDKYPHVLLTGEGNGLPIPGFDLGHSPAAIAKQPLAGKTLVQTSTNGVKAAFRALCAKEVYVTGFSNAKMTAKWVLRKWKGKDNARINMIASHPTGEDDLACALYMESIINGAETIKPESVIKEIVNASVAKKFLDPGQPAFNPADLEFCSNETDCGFVMKIDPTGEFPTIVRVEDE
ncbi:2-phosphosulfolactate phosphatase [Heyndrickxia coagulans]|uniref:Probable 2-phosphosulfolactate phosphatase n=1 Tax=Heyndrickxia coagulans DSM 1 = ATCC 7050 TaxID=1121088 RepID=A0A8B4BX31_HEYCO|nr:2-phosphosulfolactate phosphatase [Heyndrickxia coagulans]AJH79880.1 2-phosphosulfolactate phosphatase family protein [Heyndrickxia coagulans DSM 1 = ATCC 7050]MCR2846731.1 2-phosphosulfolactate phosphatase [Heyndrickxia coagulans]MDR4225155.1 2-phosphosulfolactate phosphatase [Heyndrickxia coagulans DSM 1 = ATCC 7050]MED4495153.1 2-phosphosulfolactate phosphatase [Heyndrickxia coagulans]MED4535781.1 2-phosphosulfolactate phosphatase [Heyndrickxia coagulans]